MSTALVLFAQLIISIATYFPREQAKVSEIHVQEQIQVEQSTPVLQENSVSSHKN